MKELNIALKACNDFLAKKNQFFRLKVSKISGSYVIDYVSFENEDALNDNVIGTLISGNLKEITYFLYGFYKVAWLMK